PLATSRSRAASNSGLAAGCPTFNPATPSTCSAVYARLPSTDSFWIGHLSGAGAGAVFAGDGAGGFFAGAVFRGVCAASVAHASATIDNHFIPLWYGTLETATRREGGTVGSTSWRITFDNLFVYPPGRTIGSP